MAEPLSTLPDSKTEVNPLVNQLCCEIEERKEQFLDLKEKFLISEATVVSLAKELQKYKCQKYKGIIDSVLGETFQPEEEEPADTLTLAEKLRESNLQIQDQAQELSQLRQKLRQGRDASFLLRRHLKDLFTQDDPDGHQGQSLRDQLAEGCRMAECLVYKLSTGINVDKENGEEQHSLAPSIVKERQEQEKVIEAQQDSLDGAHKTSSNDPELTDTHQPPHTSADMLDKHEASSCSENQDN